MPSEQKQQWIVLQVIAQWELLADNSRLEQKD